MAEKLIQEIGDTCILKLNNQYCVIHKGQVVVPYGKYAWIDKFDNGFARVRTEGLTNTTLDSPFKKKQEEHPEQFAKWGIINEQGEEVLPLEYDEVWMFYGKNRKSTYVKKDKQGWDFIFSNYSIPHRG